MSEAGKHESLAGALARWGLRAETLSREAHLSQTSLEERLREARQAIEEALDGLGSASLQVEPGEERARRIHEVARSSGEHATRTDLLALNFQVEAARLEDDDRGLERVADEIRSLADRGTRGAAEIGELATALAQAFAHTRGSYGQSYRSLKDAHGLLTRAIRSSEKAGTALADAQGAAAQLTAAAGVSAAEASAPSGVEAATRLATAAEARSEALERLALAISHGLLHSSEQLGELELQAEESLTLVEAFEQRLAQLGELALAAEEIARRAKQLAINADLAATRSDDPAFGFFAEEARRLSEQAEGTAGSAHVHLGLTTPKQKPAQLACRHLATSLSETSAEVRKLVQNLDQGFSADVSGDQKLERLAQEWRCERAAARELAEAQASWRRLMDIS